MKNNRLFSVLSLFFLLAWNVPAIVAAQEIKLTSPDNKTEIIISLDSDISYSINHSGQKVLENSKIGMELADGTVWGNSPNLSSKKEKSNTENILAPFYRFSEINTSYKELELKFKGGYALQFRAYNEGVAYRFVTSLKNEIEIKNEIAEFNFDKDYKAYLSYSTNTKEPFSMAFQNVYEVKPIGEAGNHPAFLPLTIDFENGSKLTITESDLEAYPGMFVQGGTSSQGLKGLFAPLPSNVDYNSWRQQEYVTERSEIIARTKGTRTFPWRVFAISQNDKEMPVNNLVYALASPNRIGDYSWINPGKSAWEWWNDWGIYDVDFEVGINMQTYKYYIDFASKYGIEYIILDEGWYTPSSGDMMTVVPELNLPELLKYATNKGVGVVLWTVFNVLDTQLEEACRYYSQLGIKGFKVDFLDRDDQYAVEMVYRIAEKTAEHKLFLDLHGIYKPTGINRTYPHIVNFEGVFGLEEAKWSTNEKDMPEYDVTFPFIRMMAGPVDYTPGAMRNATKKDFQPIYNNPLSQGTRCHQLATYIVFDSPFTMLCDAPIFYEREEDYTRFLVSIPVETEETKILDAKMGEYIVTTRRNGGKWYVGGMTNWDARTLDVEFSFLEAGKKYKVTLYKDGINANRQAMDYAKETVQVTNTSKISIPMASGGGFAMSIEEELEWDILPTSVPAHLGLDPFYKKYLDADGIPIVSSEAVSDDALIRAKRVISQILSKRKDVKDEMISKGCKLMIIGAEEEVCVIPEYAHICDTPENIAFWNKRARGFGGSPEHDFSASCGEENVICLPTDRYKGESIMVHEFAHIIHTVGIAGVDKDFDNKLEALRLKAIENNLWENTYAVGDKYEYFAEAVQSFFNCNRFSAEPNGVHNSINTRAKLKLYDPDMYNLILPYFPEIELDLCTDNKY